jgi:CRISPR-associated protein Cst2
MSLQETNNLTLVGRLTLNLASLNNEGTEGNAIQPRTATVVDDGKLHTVPVISGDMLKRWHAGHLSRIARDRDLSLCENARRRQMDPNRIKGELAGIEWVRENVIGPIEASEEWDSDNWEWEGESSSDDQDNALEEKLYELVASMCTVTDAHGLLITSVEPEDENGDTVFSTDVAVARTGRVQVGFMAGVPRKSTTKHFFHAKYATKRKGIQSRETSTGEGQNIFTRPATSAEFAVVATIDLHGIGFDDAANAHVVSAEQQAVRKKAAVDALAYTLMHQPGANSSQQFPHVTGFEGAIVTSETNCPAPSVSPMKENYLDTLRSLKSSINSMNGDEAIEVNEAQTLEEMVGKLTSLSNGSAG